MILTIDPNFLGHPSIQDITPRCQTTWLSLADIEVETN